MDRSPREKPSFLSEHFGRNAPCGIARTHVVDLKQPLSELRLEVGAISEATNTQKTVPDEADQALDRALLIARARCAQRRDDTVLADRLAHVAMQHDGLCTDGRDPDRARVVEHPLLGRAAELDQAREHDHLVVQ